MICVSKENDTIRITSEPFGILALARRINERWQITIGSDKPIFLPNWFGANEVKRQMLDTVAKYLREDATDCHVIAKRS